MIIIVGVISFLLGMLLTHLARKQQIKYLRDKLKSNHELSIEKLATANEKITRLKRENKILIKQIEAKLNDIRNNN